MRPEIKANTNLQSRRERALSLDFTDKKLLNTFSTDVNYKRKQRDEIQENLTVVKEQLTKEFREDADRQIEEIKKKAKVDVEKVYSIKKDKQHLAAFINSKMGDNPVQAMLDESNLLLEAWDYLMHPSRKDAWSLFYAQDTPDNINKCPIMHEELQPFDPVVVYRRCKHAQCPVCAARSLKATKDRCSECRQNIKEYKEAELEDQNFRLERMAVEFAKTKAENLALHALLNSATTNSPSSSSSNSSGSNNGSNSSAVLLSANTMSSSSSNSSGSNNGSTAALISNPSVPNTNSSNSTNSGGVTSRAMATLAALARMVKPAKPSEPAAIMSSMDTSPVPSPSVSSEPKPQAKIAEAAEEFKDPETSNSNMASAIPDL